MVETPWPESALAIRAVAFLETGLRKGKVFVMGAGGWGVAEPRQHAVHLPVVAPEGVRAMLMTLVLRRRPSPRGHSHSARSVPRTGGAKLTPGRAAPPRNSASEGRAELHVLLAFSFP